MNFKKKFSQNFLINFFSINNIVFNIKSYIKSIYLEIGFGGANLSKNILIKFIKYNFLIYFIEIDKKYFKKFNLIYNLNLKNDDILNFNFFLFKKFFFYKFKIVIIGNLPYNITSPLMFFLIKYTKIIKNQYFLLQKDFLLKYKYSKLFILLKSFYFIKKKFYLKKNFFFPSPKINSIFLEFNTLYLPILKLNDLFFFNKFLNLFFLKNYKKNMNINKFLNLKLKKKLFFNNYIYLFLKFKKKFIKY